MKTLNLRQIRNPADIPNGTYEGEWNGRYVFFEIDGIEYEAKAEDGSRWPPESCVVTVADGEITAELKPL